MSSAPKTSAYLRTEDAPLLPAPISMVGIQGWIIANLFPTIGNGIVSILAGAFLLWIGWGVLDWALFSAVWSGDNREVCAVEGAGACWPFVYSRLAQWIYGFYPIDQRWRVNICFVIGAAALLPMLMPSMPHKKWNALFLLIAYPLITLILLTGGHFTMPASAFLNAFIILALAATFLPLVAFGIEEGIQSNRIGLGLAGLGILVWLASFVIGSSVWHSALGSYSPGSIRWHSFSRWWPARHSPTARARQPGAQAALRNWLIAAAVLFGLMLVLKMDFGLQEVETSQWGGLLVTLVVAITGIVASLPLGILLALGRRSKMPIVKYFCVTFIEAWRGVPLITVLVHGQRHAAAVSAGRRQLRQVDARPDRRRAVFVGLHGGSRARRLAGDPEGPV